MFVTGVMTAARPFVQGDERGIGAAGAIPSGAHLVPQLGAVQYGLLIVVGVVAFALLLVVRARRRDQHDRNELRAHIRRLDGPFDPGT